MYTDLMLAILHHFLIFALAAIIAAELVLVRPGLKAETLGRLARIDGAYGLIAMLIILVGIGRVFFGLKGWEYYIYYWAFWAKMAAFAAGRPAVDPPTMRFIALAQGRRGRSGLRRSRRRDPRRALLPACRGDGLHPHPDLRRHHGARHRLLSDVCARSSGADSTSGAGIALVFTAALQMSAMMQRSHSGRRALQT